jgi:hypothetical protein
MYDRTRITFHRGNGFDPEGINPEPFAVFTIDDLVDADLIDSICTLVREHTNKAHADFCNIKLSTEQWDA